MEGGMGKQQVESLGSHGNPVGSMGRRCLLNICTTQADFTGLM